MGPGYDLMVGDVVVPKGTEIISFATYGRVLVSSVIESLKELIVGRLD